MKRGHAEVTPEAEEARKRQEMIASRIQHMGIDEAQRLLEDVATRWQLDHPTDSFQDIVTRAFDNFGVEIAAMLTPDELNSFGLKDLDEKIVEHEREIIAIYYRLRELGVLDDPEMHARVTKCMEQIYYAKRTVLSAFQGKLSLHQMGVTDAAMDEVDATLDARLGAWSLRFRWINDDTNPVQKLLLYMLDCALEKRYRRHEGSCYEPIIIDGNETHAWRRVMDIKQWIHAEIRKETNWEQWQWLTASASNTKTVVEYLTNCNDFSFPQLRKDRSTFAFSNGVYRAREDRFYPHGGEEKLPSSVAACKFFPVDFVEYGADEDIPTPFLDSIMTYQGFEADVCEWMLISLGRLMYDLNDLDGWQVIPFFKGMASSGKCFAAGTEILMHDGTIRRVEDILPGDLVMGDDSTPRTVLDLARGIEDLYRISSKYGSVTVTVTREHVLCLKSNSENVIEMTVGEYLSLHETDLRLYNRDGSVYAFDVTHVPGPQPYFGFQTDGNQRFCLADGTVTHNSTITLKVAKQFYESVDVGLLSNNSEKQFGLSAFHDKLLFVAPEIKSDLKIEQAEFQSIVSGEDIAIAIKHETAISKEWTTPGVLAGNEVPAWCDNSGSIQRRILLFDFPRAVTNGDMKLGEKLELELPGIILRCNRAYLRAASRWGDANVWSVLPKYFQATRDEMAQATNVLEAFLASHNVVLAEGMYCPFEDFKMALKVFAQQNNYKQQTRYNWEFFRGPFGKAGIGKARESREYRGRHVTRDYLDGVDLAVLQEDNALG